MHLIVSFFVLFALTLSSKVAAGCAAVGIQDVTVKFNSCTDVKAPEGSLIDLTVVKPEGRGMGMELKAAAKHSVFLPIAEKFSCKDLELEKAYCASFQKWCIMAGNPPHKKNDTIYHIRKEKCSPVSNISDEMLPSQTRRVKSLPKQSTPQP